MRKILLISLILLFLSIPWVSPRQIFADEKQTLEQQLWAIEQEISAYEKELSQTKTQKQTLLGKIEELKKKQNRLLLLMKSTKLNITETGEQIQRILTELDEAGAQLTATKKQVALLLRLIQQADLMSPVKIFFSSSNLSDFFLKWEKYLALNSQLTKELEKENKILKTIAEKLKQREDKKSDLLNLLNIQNLQKEEIGQLKQEKEGLLKNTLGKEAEYQKIVSNQKKKAMEIRNRLYELAAVKAITFGEAVKLAEWAAGKISIRPAFLLSVLTQESNLGKNVGTCNRPGDPPEKSWKVVMKPERDHEPFLALASELGFNPDAQPVSCPMKDKNGKQIGWGGAMGPAQFIPSTWQGYKEKVKSVTGQNMANPWDIRDAFAAAALLLSRNGAASQNKEGEWKAAMIYFSGSTNAKFRFYADAVMERAAQYENDIKSLMEG